MTFYEHRSLIVSGGRIQVPASVRRELELVDGDTVTIRVVDGELRVRPTRGWLARAQRELARDIPQDILLSEELIADRRAEASRE